MDAYNSMYRVAKLIKGLSQSSVSGERIRNMMNKNVFLQYLYLRDLFRMGGIDIHQIVPNASLSFLGSKDIVTDIDILLPNLRKIWDDDSSGKDRWTKIDVFLKRRLFCQNVQMEIIDNKDPIYRYSFYWPWNNVAVDYVPFRMNRVYTRVDDAYDGHILLPDLYYGIDNIFIGEGEKLGDFGYYKE